MAQLNTLGMTNVADPEKIQIDIVFSNEITPEYFKTSLSSGMVMNAECTEFLVPKKICKVTGSTQAGNTKSTSKKHSVKVKQEKDASSSETKLTSKEDIANVKQEDDAPGSENNKLTTTTDTVQVKVKEKNVQPEDTTSDVDDTELGNTTKKTTTVNKTFEIKRFIDPDFITILRGVLKAELNLKTTINDLVEDPERVKHVEELMKPVAFCLRNWLTDYLNYSVHLI